MEHDRLLEQTLGHAIIAKFFDPKVRNVGGGRRIVELPSHITVEERDFIVKAISEYINNK